MAAVPAIFPKLRSHQDPSVAFLQTQIGAFRPAKCPPGEPVDETH
jgi:hypothetical protein